MKFPDATTLDARLRLLGERLAAERLALNITQQEAGKRAGLGRNAVARAEQGRGTVESLLRLLTAYGISDRLELLLPEPQATPTELLAAERRERRQQRQRARPPRPAAAPERPRPMWGDEA